MTTNQSKSSTSTKKAPAKKSTSSQHKSESKPSSKAAHKDHKHTKHSSASSAKKPSSAASPSGIGGWVVGIIVLLLLVWAIISLAKLLPSGVDSEASITYGDSTYSLSSEEIDKFFKITQADQSTMTRSDVRDQLISLHVLLMEAEDKGIRTDDIGIQARVEEHVLLIQDQLTDEQLALELEQRGFTLEEFVAELKDSIAKDLVIQSLIKQEVYDALQLDEAELRQFYEDNLEQFQIPASVSARHILICHDKSLRCEQTRSEAEALAKANVLKDNIVNGLDFSEAAELHSEGPSNVNGGDLGQFYAGQMVKEFEDVAFEAELGAVSDPVKTAFGYHLILVYARSEAGAVSYDEALPQLDQIYRQQVVAAEESSYVNGVLAAAVIVKQEEPARS